MGSNIDLVAADGHRFSAYRAQPAAPAKGALVVIQEIFGVNSHIRHVCDRFADDGYLAIAPALFDRVESGLELGYEADDVSRGRELKERVSYEQAVADVAAAFDAADGAHVGVVGYCWGGSVTWLAATRLQPAAAVGYYGGQIIDYVGEQPRCPTMLHFGETDAGIPMTDVDSIRSQHEQVEVHTYAAGHGFSCDARGSFDAESAAIARGRTMDFFAKHL